MLRKLSVSVVLGLIIMGFANPAQAGWGSWGGSYGSYGSYGGSSGGSYGSSGGSYGSSGGSVGSTGSYGSWGGYASSGGSSGGSCGGSNGSWGGGPQYGPFARLFNHVHQKKMIRRAYRNTYYASSGGSYGSHGSWGGSYGSYGSSGYASSGGSTGSWSYSTAVSSDCCGGCDDCSGGVIDGTFIEGDSEPAAPMQSEPMEATPSEARRSVRKGVLTVSVPADAEIVVNGLPTTSTGESRRYVSHGLKPGETYRYVVKAVIERDGEQLEQTKVATLQAGTITPLEFDFDGNSAVETSLTLDVPEDAKVYLSGSETRASGSKRRFSTTRIDQGQKWADYLVRVTVERDGRTLSKEQRVTISGGDQTQLSFDFDQTELADAR